MLAARDLVRMQTAIDVNDDFALSRKLARLLVGQAAGECEPPRNILIMIELAGDWRATR